MTWLVLVMAVFAADGPEVKFGEPIAESDWAIQQDPEKGIFDAVLIQDVTIFRLNGIHTYRRVRILSESGKAAAEHYAPDGEVKDLKGRVVDRDGTEVTFDKKEDFVKILVLKTRGSREKSRVLVPPGLTRDSVVEYQWRIDAIEGLEPYTYQEIYRIQSYYHTMEKRFEIWPRALGSSDGYYVTRFISTPAGKPTEFNSTKKKGREIVTYRNVPPLELFPYGNALLDKNTAYVMMYKTFSGYPKKPSEFWAKFAKTSLKEIYSEKMSGSREYKDWLEKVKAGMPKDHAGALIHAFQAFRAKVQTPDLISPMRLSRIEKEKAREIQNALRIAIEDGYVTGSNSSRVFKRILDDLEVDYHLIFANGFDDMLFYANHMRPFGLPIFHPFFAVRHGNGNLVMVSAYYQEYPPGYIPPKYQGTPGLAVYPNNKWSHSMITLPRFGAKQHQRVTQYKTAIDEAGKMTCLLKRQVSGHLNALSKRSYVPTSNEARQQKLQDRWERRVPSMTVTSAELENGGTLDGNIVTKVALEDALEDETSDWLVITPFPGQIQPLASPNFWPPGRTQPIILNHCLTQVDLNEISLPAGWKLEGNANWKKYNEVGEVRFAAIQKGQKVTVRRDIVINKDILGPGEEEKLKTFVAWMTEAMGQRLGVSKGGQP